MGITRDCHGYELINGSKMAVKHPDSFEVPTDEELLQVRVGSIVKVGLNNDTPPEGSYGGERFWTIVRSMKVPPGGVPFAEYTAEVNNELTVAAHGLDMGSMITFGPDHILAIEGHVDDRREPGEN